MGATKSWPPIARDILLDAARYYYRSMKEPFPVPDVAMDDAIEWAGKEIESRQKEIYEDASARWMSKAEGAIRPRAGARMKTPRQLDTEIAQALKRR